MQSFKKVEADQLNEYFFKISKTQIAQKSGNSEMMESLSESSSKQNNLNSYIAGKALQLS